MLRVLILVIAFTPLAQARVLNYKEASVAPYLRGTGGLSTLDQDAFINSVGTDTTVKEGSKFDYSGELGILFLFTEQFGLRLGMEMIQHRPVKGVKGTNTAGEERFTMDSDVYAFNPNFTIEYYFANAGNFRMLAGVGAGVANTTVENRFTMTDTGRSELGVNDFVEKMSADSPSYHVLGGLETVFADNVTFSLDVGYRYLKVKSLRYKNSANTIANPSGVNKGDQVYNFDGSKRKLDLSGPFVGLSFRFYMNFL